jgi:hypothetical protein
VYCFRILSNKLDLKQETHFTINPALFSQVLSKDSAAELSENDEFPGGIVIKHFFTLMTWQK